LPSTATIPFSISSPVPIITFPFMNKIAISSPCH
jgi:hypothetical protein